MALRYVSVSGFRERLENGGGPDPSQDQSIPTHWSNDQLATFLGDAESEVETRVRARYQVPLPADPPEPVLVNLVVAIAAYHAMLAMRRNSDFESEQDPYLLRYRWATDLLDRIARGEAEIPGAGGGFTAQAFDPRPGALFTADHFGVRDPAGPDRITDIRRPYRGR